jgi:hypothetical protein
VLGLVGLRWNAPYLHDGGVAVGPDRSQAGLPATTLRGVPPDPSNSLRALLDRRLRAAAVAANRADEGLRSVRVEGVRHEYWADREAGFSEEEQADLVRYLLAFPGR